MKLVLRYLTILGLVLIIVIFLTQTFPKICSHLDLLGKYPNDPQLMNEALSNKRLESSNLKKSTKNSSAGAGNSGNPLIYNYGKNNLSMTGENGNGVTLTAEDQKKAAVLSKEYNINVFISDLIPLNRMVPDSRPVGCSKQVFDESNMPEVAIIIPFYNEWPSILLRTIYSIINRTPPHLLKEIILIDDNSNLKFLKEDLNIYIEKNFDKNLVKVFHLKERSGLIKARLEGFKYVTAEVACIFDSHMEVNIQWLQPLLEEIMKNRSTIVISQLDYINKDTLAYNFDRDYKIRYGFSWNLVFFEMYFRSSQVLNKKITDHLPGPVMVGAGFAVDVKFFKRIGLYDTNMKIWGGENLELAWRVWSCGGQVLHKLCSHIGHIARSQPYNFPEGRSKTEIFNYKRAVDVWLGPYKKYIYNYFPSMKDMDVGDLSDRLKLKKELKCKDFDWYLDNIWPELFRFQVNVTVHGELRNTATNRCLDNENYFYPMKKRFSVRPCSGIITDQGFSLTQQKWLRTTLNCVSADCPTSTLCFAVLKGCFDEAVDIWEYKDGFLKHKNTGFCLDLLENKVILRPCNNTQISQRWQFTDFPTRS